MSPWVNGKWQAPTKEQRAERGLSVLPEHATPEQKAQQTQAQVFGGGASAGFVGKMEEAFGQQPTQPTQPQAEPLQSPGDMSWWEKTKQAWQTGVAQMTPATAEDINAPWEEGTARLGISINESVTLAKDTGKLAAYGAAIGFGAGFIGGAAGLGGTATNAKTVAASTGILTAAGMSLAGAGLAVSILGTYPFAGFIEEEAAQTLNFAFKASQEAGDLDGMGRALNAKAELLEVLSNAEDIIPDSTKPDDMSWEEWEKLPIANVMASLERFVKAEKVTLAAQRELVKRLREGTDKWTLEHKEEEERAARITADRIEQQRIANEAQAALILAAQQARDAEEKKILKENIKLWEDHKKRILELEKEAMIANAAFWLEYTKEKMKFYENQQRSQLVFGLL